MADDDHPAIPMIQGFEDFRPTPYWDVNHYRVGYGSDTITKPDGTVAEVTPGMTVSTQDANRDLRRRVGDTQTKIQQSIGPDTWSKLSPSAQAALTSVHYNYGHLPYDVQIAAQSGDPQKIAAAIAGRSGDNDGVNAARRAAEAASALGTTPGTSQPGTKTPTTAAAASSSTPALALLQGLMKKVPEYTPNAPGGATPQSRIEGMLRAAAGQGTYTPAFVAKAKGLGDALSSLLGGSSTGPGSPPGPAVAQAQPDAATPPTAPSPASVDPASAGGGATLPNAPDGQAASLPLDAVQNWNAADAGVPDLADRLSSLLA